MHELVTINVTQEDIDAAYADFVKQGAGHERFMYNEGCPVAKALRRTFKSSDVSCFVMACRVDGHMWVAATAEDVKAMASFTTRIGPEYPHLAPLSFQVKPDEE